MALLIGQMFISYLTSGEIRKYISWTITLTALEIHQYKITDFGIIIIKCISLKSCEITEKEKTLEIFINKSKESSSW